MPKPIDTLYKFAIRYMVDLMEITIEAESIEKLRCYGLARTAGRFTDAHHAEEGPLPQGTHVVKMNWDRLTVPSTQQS